MAYPWTLGIEIELLAPQGLSRLVLAEGLAAMHQGQVNRFFHPQSEPSKLPNTPVMENLTLGFEVTDSEGKLVARCVDDLTLQADCNKQTPPRQGWYRIVSDDARLLRLVSQVASASDPLETVLQPVAALFGVELIQGPNGMVKVSCEDGLPIAVAAPLPGERERPCELISPPLLRSEIPVIEKWINLARDLNFTAPHEGATHIHIDASHFCSPSVFRNLVTLLWLYGDLLRMLFKTNPHCRKIGTIPKPLWEMVHSDQWNSLDWIEACEHLKKLSLSKYMDFNLRNLIYKTPNKHTIEVRILPVWLEYEPLIMAIDLIQAVFERSFDPMSTFASPGQIDITNLLNSLSLSYSTRTYWLQKLPSLQTL
jgi:hypothetical protein